MRYGREISAAVDPLDLGWPAVAVRAGVGLVYSVLIEEVVTPRSVGGRTGAEITELIEKAFRIWPVYWKWFVKEGRFRQQEGSNTSRISLCISIVTAVALNCTFKKGRASVGGQAMWHKRGFMVFIVLEVFVVFKILIVFYRYLKGFIRPILKGLTSPSTGPRFFHGVLCVF